VSGEEVKRRASVYLLLVFLSFALLQGRLIQLQVLRGEELAVLAQENRVHLVTLEARRGTIFDRNGRIIAGVRPSFELHLVYMNPRQVETAVARLSALTGWDREELERKIQQQRYRWYQPVTLARDISPEVHTLVEEHRYELPGVMVEAIPRRVYPWGRYGAHLVGYMGEINASELERLGQQGYRPGDWVGKAGLERQYETDLRGQRGGRQVEADALGRPVRELGEISPVPGNDLFLTIDMELQQVAEEALEEAIAKAKAAHPDYQRVGMGGAVVVLDPHTGDVLALVSQPAYDPNWFVTSGHDEELHRLTTDPRSPFTNRAVTSQFPPGSAFKLVTALAALQDGVTDSRELFFDSGVFRVAGKRCWREGGHGWLNLVEAIGQSCNVVFYELGLRLGIDRIAHYARLLGLEEPTGLGLSWERQGLVPDREWKRRAYEEGLYGIVEPTWWDAETLDAAIGQGFHRYSPLQMAQMVATLATGGVRYRPRLVTRICTPDGQVLREFPPVVAARVSLDAAALAVVREGMRRTCEPGGTAGLAFLGCEVPVAGKTGTAEVPVEGWADHAWFVGYAPASAPQVVVVVMVEHGGKGGEVAAPVARRVIDHYFGVAPR